MKGTQTSVSPVVDFTFCPVLEEIIRTGSMTGRSGKRFEELGALSTTNNLHMLRRLQLELKAGRTLEIGLSFGASCLMFTATHREISGRAGRQHMALDPFQTEAWDDSGLLAVERAGLSDYLDFRPQFSSLVLPRLVENGEQFDLIYVDGSHLFEDVFIDAYYTARLLSEGGVVAFDDCRDAHVLKVIEFIRRNLPKALEEVDLSPFRADQGKSIKYRAARMMGRTQMRAFRRIGALSRPWNAPFHNF
jgi:predicted O-methyltransferase YrrM